MHGSLPAPLSGLVHRSGRPGRHCDPDAVLCPRCSGLLASCEPLHGAGPAGLDRVWSSAAHEGAARDLVAALKFRRPLPVIELMADRIHALAPTWMLSGEIVPVPTSPLRFSGRWL